MFAGLGFGASHYNLVLITELESTELNKFSDIRESSESFKSQTNNVNGSNAKLFNIHQVEQC